MIFSVVGIFCLALIVATSLEVCSCCGNNVNQAIVQPVHNQVFVQTPRVPYQGLALDKIFRIFISFLRFQIAYEKSLSLLYYNRTLRPLRMCSTLINTVNQWISLGNLFSKVFEKISCFNLPQPTDLNKF